jgi:cation-dependent mannose-6-phosphate receptor
LIAILTWFGGYTLYNRFFLKKRGLEQFPIPRFSMPSLSLPSFKKSSEPSRPRWGFGRRSQRGGGYTAMNQDETEHFAGRFSLSSEDEDEDHREDLTGGGEDARVLGGEAREWRGQRRSQEREEGRVGVHQGLVDV